MNKIIIVAIIIIILFIFSPQISKYINPTTNTTTTTTSITTTTETQTIIEPNNLGLPCNKYGCFQCAYDTDCKIYFDCANCFCDKPSGNCKQEV